MENIEFTNANPERPALLKVLCILTFIFSGLLSLSAIFIPAFSEQMGEFIQNDPNYTEAQKTAIFFTLHLGWGYYLLVFTLAASSLVGAILMWNLKKIGFHMYALSNSLYLLVPMLMLATPLDWREMALTASFILLYALNLKYMK